jgi:alpha/beta superfamily hydrolase
LNLRTQRVTVAGPAGAIACAVDTPGDGARGVAVICHPHPLHGGTLDNKVVQTVARAAVQLGLRAVRFDFRGAGGSAGAWDEGRGEVDDALAVVAAQRQGDEPLLLAGFSFGGFVAARAAQQVTPRALLLVAPAVVNFPLPPVSPEAIVVHGEADDVVPLAGLLDWARPQALPVIVVPGVGHFFHGQLPLLKSLLIRSLSPLLA